MTANNHHHPSSSSSSRVFTLSSNNPSSPPSPSHLALRLGTVNIGCGFLRKLPILLRRAIALSLNVIAVQEIGDPALMRPHTKPYFIVTSPGPSMHEAGVGLLLSHHLAPHCRSYLRSKSGRLVGAIIEIAPHQRLLIISAYMPSGLDHATQNDPKMSLARQLYCKRVELLVVVCGTSVRDEYTMVGELGQHTHTVDMQSKRETRERDKYTCRHRNTSDTHVRRR
jgi:hypothetical protein